MLTSVLPTWNFKKIPLALVLVLLAMVLPALASAKVAEAGIDQSSTPVPLPESRSVEADAQAPLFSVSDARQVSENRRIRVAGPGRRSCTHLGCSGHSIVGIGY